MHTHTVNWSGDNFSRANVELDFHLDPADRASLSKFGLSADELVAALRDPNVNLARSDHPTLSRPDLQPVMQMVLTAGLVGAGMSREDARVKAFHLMHNGVGLQRSRAIVLKLLTGE